MTEDELVRIWQSSPNQERVKFDRSRLMIDVQSTLDDVHKKIKQRDLREQLAIMVGVPIFAYYIYSVPFMVTKIASALFIVWGIYVAFRLRKAKKQKPGAFTESYLEYLYKSKEYLNIQKQMLDNILYWYILPPVVLLFAFVLGPGIEGRGPVIVKMSIIIIAFSLIIYYLNKRAIKKQIDPKLEKIDRLIEVIENPQ